MALGTGLFGSSAPAPAAPSPYLGGGGGSGYQIGGPLNFGSVPFMDFSGSPGGLAASYGSAYQNALGLNQSNYQNILAGYQQTMGNQLGAQAGINAGYANLYGDVLGGIQGMNASQQQAINDAYARQSGQLSQQMIDRGLGNTTVQGSMQRGLTLDQQKALVANSNAFAGTQAQYQSQLGLAGLGYQAQAAAQNTALAQQQLAWMNSVSAPYPDASVYARLAQMYGQGQGANAALQKLQQARVTPPPAGPRVSYGGGSFPGPTPQYGSSASAGGYPTGYGYNPALQPVAAASPVYYSPAPADWGGGGDWGMDPSAAAAFGVPAAMGYGYGGDFGGGGDWTEGY